MTVYRPLPVDHDTVEYMRRIARESRELLKQSPPDTFLGRRTHEPFQGDGDATPNEER
ncbi:hypothetical protein I6F30_10465 [Bradyrhizobium sp. NBAIM20]|uniref:hypothetical protein n=1 Tax=unclassified Bradyrhizobium TaxID=2631580 RepID=UPI001CD39DE5|nr:MULTISPECIES: hypothetical protein [unclassified Bradyrhizobium]MCA1411572.1 hypothetical protein [Bradyrhizobium sp. NBAIM20]MCA1462810.1 hypothetical protein [Bradyrhizobium sp. NBAIM18]